MSDRSIIVAKLASFHEAYYRRYILFCPFHRIKLEPVYLDQTQERLLMCMSRDIRYIQYFQNVPKKSLIASVNSAEQIARIAKELEDIYGIKTQLDMLKIQLKTERYRMEHEAETIIAENYMDEYEFIMRGYNNTAYTHYFYSDCLIDLYVNACINRLLEIEPSVVKVCKALHEVEFHPVEVCKIIKGETNIHELAQNWLGGVQ